MTERYDERVEPSPTRLAFVLALGVVAVGLAAIFVRLADAPGVVVAAYRMVAASLILSPWTLRALKKTSPTPAALGYTVLAGVFLGAHFATWITSLSYTSVAASVTLVTTSPLWVALFSWLFLGVAPAFAVILGALTAVLGGSLIGFGDLRAGSAPLVGDLLALAGAVTISAYFLLGRAAQARGLSLQAYIGVAYGVAAVVLLPLPLLLRFSYTGYSLTTLFWILLLALVPQLVGHTSFNYALKYLDPTVVATVTLLEPLVSTSLALLFLREVPGALTLVGAVILLSGVALTTRNARERRADA